MIAKQFKIQSIILYFDTQPPLVRYGLAMLAVAIAATATQHIPVIGERAAFLLFFFAIIQSTFWLGRNPGLLAMALSFIAVNAIVLFPVWISKPYDVLILNMGFCVLATVFIATTSNSRSLTSALWESRQDLNHAQAIGQTGSWRMDVQSNELRWSDENHRIFGILKGTPLTYETFLSTVHPDDRDYVDRKWQAALRGELYDIEHRVIVAGQVKWVRERAELEFGKNGLLLGGFGATQDVTDQKRNELLLAESRQRYAGIIESAMDAMITIDANQRILVFNAAAEKMFGCTEDEAIGGSVERFIPERFRPAHNSHIRAFGHTGPISRKMGTPGDIMGLRANGDEFPIEASISYCEINGEKSFTAILRDITERIQAELTLKERLKLQDQLTKVAATVPGVICSFRLRPDGSASMPYASPVFESVYGFSHEIIAEDFSPVFARIHPDDINHINETIAESARTLQPWQDTFRYNHPIKGEIWIEGHSMPQREMDGSVLWHGYIQDITDRKRTETALHDRENELRLIMDATPALISYLDADFRYLRVNKTYENWFCLAQDSILGHGAREIVGERAWNIVQPYLERVLAGERINFDQQIPYGTGKPRWVNASYIPDKDSTGTVKGIVAHIIDIEERKLAEEALRENEVQIRLATERHLHELQVHKIDLEMQNEELRQASIALETSRSHYLELYDFAPVGYVTLTLEGMITEINLTASKLLGMERNKLIHQHFVQFITDEHKDRWHQFYGRAKQQGNRQSIELPIRHNDGTSFCIHVDCQYKKVNDAVPLLRIALVDITERKRAEVALHESEARLALVVEEVKAGYWDWDLNTHTLFLSSEWNRQLGLDDNELLVQWDQKQDRLHPDDRAFVRAASKDFIAGRLPVYELEFRLRHKDGSYRWIHSRSALLRDQHNRPYRMLGINLDITDYKQAQELSERRDKMEQASRLYVASQTAAAIAHELNQPLTAISYYADVAQELLETGNPNPQKLSNIMEKCSQQALRAGEVIRQLMAVLHKGETISEAIDINTAIHEAFDHVKADGHLGDFKIKLKLAAGLPPVTANGLQIQKVLINLLHNGLESMQESEINTGTITVTTRRSIGDSPMAQVTVCDSGTGVTDTATLKTIFQPFYTTKPTGLGMGLAISRALIEAHGGKMWAEQNADRGVSIHFTLPFVT